MTSKVKHPPPPFESTFFKCQLVENKVSSLMRGEKVRTTADWEYDASSQGFPGENISQKFLTLPTLEKYCLSHEWW